LGDIGNAVVLRMGDGRRGDKRADERDDTRVGRRDDGRTQRVGKARMTKRGAMAEKQRLTVARDARTSRSHGRAQGHVVRGVRWPEGEVGRARWSESGGVVA
jgi:hypothetical protein